MQWNVRVIPLTGETFYPFLFSLPSNTIWNEKRCDVVYFTQTKHKVKLSPRWLSNDWNKPLFIQCERLKPQWCMKLTPFFTNQNLLFPPSLRSARITNSQLCVLYCNILSKLTQFRRFQPYLIEHYGWMNHQGLLRVWISDFLRNVQCRNWLKDIWLKIEFEEFWTTGSSWLTWKIENCFFFPFSLNFWMRIWFYPLSQTMPIPREYRDSFGVGGVKNQTAFLKFLSLTFLVKTYLFIFFQFSSSSSLESRVEMISKRRIHSTLDLNSFLHSCTGKKLIYI